MTTWYIDPQNGDDANSGTSEDAPLKSYSKVGWTSSMLAGDKILQKRGSVFSNQISMTNWKNNITLSAYGVGPKPIIDPEGGQYLSCISIANSAADISGVIVDGFDLRGATYYLSTTTAVGAGIRIAVATGRQVQNIRVRNCDIHDCFYGLKIDMKSQAVTSKVTGNIIFENNNVYSTRNAWVQIMGSDTPDCYVRGVTIRKNKFFNSGSSNGIIYSGSAHGVSIQTRDTAGSAGFENVAMNDAMAIQDIVIEDNDFDTNLGYALFLKGVQSSVAGMKRNKIRRNTVKRFGWTNDKDTHGIWVGGCDDVLIEKNAVADGGVYAGMSYGAGVGIFVDRLSNVDGCKRVTVRQNKISRCGRGPTAAVDAGSGIYVYVSQDVSVTANVIIQCRSGIYVQGGGVTFPTMNVLVANNTLIDNFVLSNDGGYDGSAIGLAIISGSAECQNVTVKNNVIQGGKVGLYRQNVGIETTIDESNNIFYNIGNDVESGVVYGQGSVSNRDNPLTSGVLAASDMVANPMISSEGRALVGSPLIGAGAFIKKMKDFDNMWFSALGPTIGAYQFNPRCVVTIVAS